MKEEQANQAEDLGKKHNEVLATATRLQNSIEILKNRQETLDSKLVSAVSVKTIFLTHVKKYILKAKPS